MTAFLDPSYPSNGWPTRLRPQAKLAGQQQRTHHLSLVLCHLFHDGPMSRADLARATGLTRVTISDLVDSLITERLIEECGKYQGPIGKPSVLLKMRTEDFSIIAVDLSRQSQIRGSVVSLSGVESIGDIWELTQEVGGSLIDALIRFIRHLATKAEHPVIGVGVGSPGVIDTVGTVIAAPNRGWFNVPLAQVLSEALQLPVYAANDSDCAAMGEFSYGKAAHDCLVMAIRQGVGAGLILGGNRVQGAHHAAGEIGHVTVSENSGERCACGRWGCLETLLSNQAMSRRLKGLGVSDQEKLLADCGQALGRVLAPVVSALNLQEVILSGPHELLDGTFSRQVFTTIVDRTMPAVSQGLVVRMSALGDRGVLAGAAGLVLSAQLGVS